MVDHSTGKEVVELVVVLIVALAVVVVIVIVVLVFELKNMLIVLYSVFNMKRRCTYLI